MNKTLIDKYLKDNDYESLNKMVNKTRLKEDIFNYIISLKNARIIYSFAFYIDKTSVNKFASAIIKTNDLYYIYMFAREIEGAPLKKFTDYFIKKGNPEFLYLYSFLIKDKESLYLLENAIIETNRYSYIYLFARDIKEIDINPLENAIIASKKIPLIYLFLINVKGANQRRLKRSIILSFNIKYIFKMLLNKNKILNDDSRYEYVNLDSQVNKMDKIIN